MTTALPAIDVSDGAAVRLVQGELSNQTRYGTPLDVAKEFVQVFDAVGETNRFVHLVDLDAAFGRGSNFELLANVTDYLSQNNVNVELSGGIRDTESLERALSTGCARVNIGTAALEDPEWTASVLEKYGQRVAISLAVRGETLAARGWVKEGGNLWEVLTELITAGCTRFVVTDVNKDGTLQGPNLELLESVASAVRNANSSAKVTVSGGISSITDLEAVVALDDKTQNIVDSVIFGKALYSGAFTLAEALNVLSKA